MNQEFADNLNEPQVQTIDRLRHALRGAHYVDVVVRKDGDDHGFEADWLRFALDILCGGPLPSRIPDGWQSGRGDYSNLAGRRSEQAPSNDDGTKTPHSA